MPAFLDTISLRIRATALIVTILCVTAAAAALLTIRTVNRQIAADQTTVASTIARSVAKSAEVAIAARDEAELIRIVNGYAFDKTVLFVGVYDSKGRPLAQTSAPVKDDSTQPSTAVNPIAGSSTGQQLVATADVFIRATDDLVVGSPPVVSQTPIGSVKIGLSTEPMHAAQSMQARAILSFSALAVFIGAVIAFAGATSWTRRLRKLVDTSDLIASGQIHTPAGDKRTDEIGQLASSLNQISQSLLDRDAELKRFSATLQDQVRERTRELEGARNVAESAAHTKSNFLANMSHEIRTPMTAIIGFTGLLAAPDCSTAERKSHVATIQRNGEHLLVLINDILDISKIDAGKMTVEMIAASPARIARDVHTLLANRASESGLELSLNIDPSVPEMIATDATRLRQILTNLVGNAVKFTPSGTVAINVCAKHTGEPGKVELRFSVSDSGLGIEPDQLVKLFKPFIQADNSMTRKAGGTGLGLAISRALAQLLGGDIEVTSEVGKGTIFTLTIVAQIVAASNAPAPAGAPANAGQVSRLTARVLLAEDGLDNQRLIKHYLTKAGASVDVSDNGIIALQMLTAADAAGQPYDILLSDMQMPEMDGYTLATTLRQRGSTLPIIALTAHAMAGDRAKCMAAGCDAYASKPINPRVLIELIAHHVSCPSQASYRVDAEAPPLAA